MWHSIKHIVGYSLPLIIFLIVFGWFGQWQIDGDAILMSSGITGLTLFGIIFIIGPLPRFWHDLTPWKVFRPYWAKWAVLIIFVHILLAIAVSYNLDVVYLFSRANPQFVAILAGLTAFLYFFFMVVISERSIRAKLGPHWKQLHTAGYLAFGLALLHFYLVLSGDGQFSPSHPIERLLFVFGVMVLVLRGYVFIWAHFDGSGAAAPVPPSTNETAPGAVSTDDQRGSSVT